MNVSKIKGYLFAAIAAAAYGTNPAFAVPLYAHGMNPNSVLLFRYVMGIPILAVIMKVRGVSFSLKKESIASTALLGILMALSSLSLFESYEYMNSGIASTLLFVYPVMVAIIMIIFFHERFKASVAICLLVMAAGLWILAGNGNGEPLSAFGCLLVMVSALTYAFYIVFINVSKHLKEIPTTRLLFYVLIWGSLLFAAIIPFGHEFSAPSQSTDWINLLALTIIPTVLSLSCTTRAIQLIGSTPTAILGALEPVSAVILSVIVLGQPLSWHEIVGGIFIVVATTMVVADKTIDKALLHVYKMFPNHLLR